MITALLWALASLGVAGSVGAVLYYLRRVALGGIALSERTTALELERQRVTALEKARAAERKAKAVEFDAAKDSVRTVTDAAVLLRGELSRPGSTPAK